MRTKMKKRKPSYFQSGPWMRKIGKLKKYKTQAFGEANGKCKVPDKGILEMRNAGVSEREKYCKKYGITSRYWWLVRSEQRRKKISIAFMNTICKTRRVSK
jgi:hypothetical protein